MLRSTAAVLTLLAVLVWSGLSWAGTDEGWAALDAGDYAAALKEFQPLAEAGDADAQNVLGDIYYAGTGVDQSYDIAADWYRKAAAQGNAWAQMNLGWMFESGTGVAQDYEQAEHWFRLAADQGFGLGQYALANLYYDGNGVPQDYSEAARLYRSAADQGIDWAQFRLGNLYFDGFGFEQNTAEAVRWYRQAAAQGLGVAQEALDRLASQGVNIAAVTPAETLAGMPEGAKGGGAIPAAGGGQIARVPGIIGTDLGATPAKPQVRVALVIGNSDYAQAPLANPETDISIVRPALESMGFQVTAVSNADIAAFDAAVTRFVETAHNADIALFYYAGHGFALNDGIIVRNYLLSTSADVTSTSDRVIRSSGIPLDEIVDQISAAAKVSLFFVDACRNDPRVTRGNAGGRGLAPVASKGNDVFIGVSTRIGDTAADGTPGEGSPFARAFAEQMTQPGLRVDDAFTRVRLAVEAETQTQRPEILRDDLSAPATVVLSVN